MNQSMWVAGTSAVRPLVVATLLVSMLAATGCGSANDPWEGDGKEGALRVVVSVAPLESFTRAVGGDRVVVRSLCTQTGPHGYQTDTRDARVLGKADLFLSVGLSLDESFSLPMIRTTRRKDLRHVQLGEKFPETALLEMKHSCCKHGEHDHTHTHGKWDPHVWLGIAEAVRLVELIRDELTQLDPEGAATYKENTAAYVADLRKLQEEGKAALAKCYQPRIVSFHEALGYFARSFGVEIADVIEQGPGDEPTQGHLTDLIKVCSDPKKPVDVITVEPQYPTSSSASVIQNELKRKQITMPLATVDPLETAEPKDLAREGGQWYITRMRQNLKSLSAALPDRKNP